MSSNTWEPEDILTRYERLLEESTEYFDDALKRYARALVRGDPTGGPTERINVLLMQTMQLADLMAREDVVRQASGARPANQRDIPNGMVPRVEFKDAIADILTRTPVLARSYREVQERYSQEHVFAVAKSATEETTRAVQRAIADAQAGSPGRETMASTARVITEVGDWTRAYAETVYRTNMATAHASGQMAMVADPAIRSVAPALEFVSAKKATTRPNHHAAHGLVADAADPVWQRFTPPLGYNCFCCVRIVFYPELRRRGLLGPNDTVLRYEPPTFDQAFPDPGFGTGNPAVTAAQGAM
jgi:SPP1 gp7 family putative phage head morphogenesis protein